MQGKSELNLIILGSGNEEKKLKEIIPKKFKNRIFFPGKVDSRKFLSEANMYILTSDYEGMPNVVLEAMSYSLPIVIYKANNEIDSFLKHNHSAFFLDKVRKKMKLKDILRNYDKNSSEFRKMGMRAKTRFDMIDNKKFMRYGEMSQKINDKIVLFPFVGDSVGGSHIASVILIKKLKKIKIGYKVILFCSGPLEIYLKKEKIDFSYIDKNNNYKFLKFYEIVIFFF